MANTATTACPKISARARLQTDRVTGKPVLLYPEGVLILNATGEAIVSLCDGHSTVTELISALASRYQVPADAITGDVMQYLDRLRERNLVEWIEKAGEPAA